MSLNSTTLTRGAGLAAFAAAAAVTAFAAGQRPLVTIKGDEISVRGCVANAGGARVAPGSTLLWSPGDIMMAVASAGRDAHEAAGPAGLAGRVFYWLDSNDLSKHVGQQVELKGELHDFEKSEVDVERHDDFTEITLHLNGKKEEARVPTSWLGSGDHDHDHDQNFDIVTRRIEVKDVDVLGACRAD
jgi:hypothetical protein